METGESNDPHTHTPLFGRTKKEGAGKGKEDREK